MIYTANIDRCKDSKYQLVSIDPRIDRQSNLGFYSDVMPTIDEISNWKNKELIHNYYLKYLRKLKIEKLLKDLDKCVIVSKDDFFSISTRRVLADYLELTGKILIPEVEVYGAATKDIYKPVYIKDELRELIYTNGEKHE